MNATVALASGNSASIQEASWRDLGPVRQLEKLCFPLDSWPLLDILGVLTLPNVIRLKAIDNTEIIGFVAAETRRSQNIAWVATICVHPERRGQKIGENLMQECEARLDIPKVRLSVRASNSAAINLYARMDYVEIGSWPRYYKGGEDATVMEKVLI